MEKQGTFVTFRRKNKPGPFFIVAHRGASHHSPENTLAAFRRAWKEGADAIEGDFRRTRDGHVVAIHDSTTRRTAGVHGSVARQTLKELRALDVGAWKGLQWKGQRIPTLPEVLATLPKRGGKRLFLEIKSGPRIVPELKRRLERSRVRPQRVVLMSFHAGVMASVRRLLPRHKSLWLFHFRRNRRTGRWNATRSHVVRTAKRLGVSGVGLGVSARVDATLARMLQRAGLEWHVWTVDDPAVARRMIALGASSITTNRPRELRWALKWKDSRGRDLRGAKKSGRG